MGGFNNVTTTAEYVESNVAGTNALILIVANAAIYMQYSAPAGGGSVRESYAWGEEDFYPPGYYTLPGPIEQIRIRSAVAGSPAQVTANVY